jgi:hypothetical protein
VTLAQVRSEGGPYSKDRQEWAPSQLEKRTLGNKTIARRGNPPVKQVLQEERRPKATWDAADGNGYGFLGAERRA